METSPEVMDIAEDEQVEEVANGLGHLDLEGHKRPSYAEIAARITETPDASGHAEAPKQKPWKMCPIVVKAVTQKDRPRSEPLTINPFDDFEEDGMDDLIFKDLANKASVSLTRSRGPNLTPKQQEIKQIRINAK